jgi:nicotinamidase-related amidase
MNPALIVVDLLRDTFEMHPESSIVQAAQAFMPRLNDLIAVFHQKALPVVFACDTFCQGISSLKARWLLTV